MNRNKIKITALFAITVILAVLNIFFGAVHIPAESVLTVLAGQEPSNEAYSFIIIQGRIPQSVTALLAGASLAAAGLMLQTLFRNPLAGPSILGITSGASLGVALVLLCFGMFAGFGLQSPGSNIAVVSGAFGGSMLVLAFLLILSRKVRSNLTLLIVGMMVGYLASSLITLLSSMSAAREIQNYVTWGMGNFSGVSLDSLPVFSILCLVGLFISILAVKQLNLLLLGDNYAANLGVNLKKTRMWLLLSTGILSAVVTAWCGPIGFIGLAMPHIARLLFRTDDHRLLLPATMLCGSILALACNIVSVMPRGIVIPINALTPLAGVPVVLYVVLRSK